MTLPVTSLAWPHGISYTQLEPYGAMLPAESQHCARVVQEAGITPE